LRGFGAEIRESAALSFVSMHPPDCLNSAVVLPGAGAGPTPSKQKLSVAAVPPYPTRSMMLILEGHAPESAVAPKTSATFPVVAAIAIVPLASGVGKLVVPPLP
jgi:hypothetical protein